MRMTDKVVYDSFECCMRESFSYFCQKLFNDRKIINVDFNL